MAPQRKRENRENQFYDVGVQGRKTGITLADRGVYDEHGLEPISGIFSSPEKSPPKRSETLTASESMEMQESSIPDLTTSRQILRNSRTHLPPPRSRSPKKTALGSSPRRQSSMAPRGSSIGLSSPARAASHPVVARRLDFEQDESSIQETPALSGSGQRRGKRASVYDIPEDGSPVPQSSAVLEESLVQEEITANDTSVALDIIDEESIAQIGEDTLGGAETMEDLIDAEETEVTPEPVKEPARRGRKRKSDVMESAREESPNTAKAPKRGAASAPEPDVRKKAKKPAPAPSASSRRSKRVSDMVEQESSVVDASVDMAVDLPEEVEEAQVPIKRRGRPARPKPEAEKENTVPSKATKDSAAKAKSNEVFKKPQKPAAKQKPGHKSKADGKSSSETPEANAANAGRLVDGQGNPLSKNDIEQMSTTSTTSRYGRGRHLSVFRELEPEAVARVGRTGRHRVAPINFWANDRIVYDIDRGMTSIVKAQEVESERKRYKSVSRGRKRISVVEEEEIELDPWEEDDGVLVGNYRDYDPVTDVTTSEMVESKLAWSQKGIKPVDVPDGSFQFVKLSSAGDPAASFFNWGLIELRADQMKRSKNSRKMHMVFNVQSGTVEVKVAENDFMVHKGGIWHVPRGNTYSIKNIGSGTAKLFFAQAREKEVQEEE